ncbi:MAG: nicotinate (nicotinamide) nucleotide adenylyltransferase [Candidatus Sericytochromatia bacterium]|nr:nicotinate (nicotinamide) nucleotide adenylyltransferase [Candidatus Sericytochromatia bacterium]
MPQKTALLGGTFDPIHIGHLNLAEGVCHALGLDEVLFIPAGQPPHKPGVTPAHHRLEMVRQAVADNPSFAVSDLELQREGPSYTLLTLQAMRQQHPDDALWWILGADALLGLHTWHQYQRFPDYVRFAVTPRPGVTLHSARDLTVYLQQQLPQFVGFCDWVDVPPLAVASSDLRRTLAAGCGRYLLPAAVWRYIEAQALYLSAPEI